MHVVATAGHVDHGKSTLVRVLTDTDPDRWAEERRRGMTIDLGYAWTKLPSGEWLAFVDVPGHERFVTNMLSGVGPVPAVMIVVAADEGWMPQSAEHLAAIDALGVRDGLLVVTRSDREDPETAIAEAQSEIVNTCLGEVEAVAVSGITGDGIPALRSALSRLVRRLPAPDDAAPVRLWVDRSFTIRGSGTVVTGTLPAGRVRVGDELLLAPGGARVRVRGLESLKERVDTVTAVARVAVNLRGVDKGAVTRGMALVTPEHWTITDQIDVRLRGIAAEVLPREPSLHIGSASTAVYVRPLGPDTARLTLASPLPLHIGDRAILRDPGSRRIAGLTVLDVCPPPIKRRGGGATMARELAGWPEVPDAQVLLSRHKLLRRADLVVMGCEPQGRPVAGDWLADPAHWESLRTDLTEAVAKHAANHPLDPGLTVDAARQQLGLPDRRLAEALVQPPLRLEAGRIVRPSQGPSLPPEVTEAVDRLRQDLERSPFQAPEASRLAQLRLTGRTLAAAARAGAVLRIADTVVLLPEAEAEAVRILGELRQPFTASEARRALDTSRRVVIPFLEFLDQRGHTVRVDGNSRRLKINK
ncbi:selenocysteine-specific elongation factor [Nonomuraea polychroma]|uniref:Selenocysteine-specific elongation factor n=1 Tax=Nonomuraea polychroma TaxID=46176 RepID=A0A438M295_9ACTN|nr:selenocysteine-specific translation elongation factor [Nonomuraea polychroma]RVX39761.1 selenocysteine-specific elongation factor [Nonomuraea polychroma]